LPVPITTKNSTSTKPLLLLKKKVPVALVRTSKKHKNTEKVRLAVLRRDHGLSFQIVRFSPTLSPTVFSIRFVFPWSFQGWSVVLDAFLAPIFTVVL
jgi:hypothetical protein